MHLNAFFDLTDRTYTDALIQAVHCRNEFSPERIKELYHSRWGIESSFRKLKYTVGLSNFHSYKPEYIEQEIWAKLIAYNMTEIMNAILSCLVSAGSGQ